MENEFAKMRPDQILARMNNPSVALLPVGSLEWHGRHMNFGMDTCHAWKVCVTAAKKTGAVILPPLYIGTETKRSKEQLLNLGFSGNEDITGVDFPSNTIASMYFPPEMFRDLISYETSYLKKIGFRKIIIVNGHGADIQISILNEVAKKYSDKNTKVLNFLCFLDNSGFDPGHACLLETSIMLEINDRCVDIKKLPPRNEPLKFTENGFFDGKAISGNPNGSYTVEFDPRDATKKIGKTALQETCRRLVELIGTAIGNDQS